MITIESYKRPRQLDDALQLMSSGEFTPLAGGTDLLILLRDNKPVKILDLADLGLNIIADSGDRIEIGASVTHASLASDGLISKSLPALAKASSLIGSQQIRNRGTVGGNIVNASPCADTVPALLLYEAELILKSAKGPRTVPLSGFIYDSYKTSIRPDEIFHSIVCKKPATHNGWSYTKLGRRQAVNISRMTVAVSFAIEGKIIRDARISAGSVFPTASRIPDVEKMLMGESRSQGLFEEAANKAAELMIRESGYRWSTPYKQPVLVGLLIRAFEEAANYQANGVDK